MKRYLLTFSLLAICCLGYGQTAESIFKEFKHEKNTDFVSVPSFLMSIAKCFIVDREDDDLIQKGASVKVLDLEKCSGEVKKRFNKRIEGLNGGEYETLLRVNDEKDKVRILTKKDKKGICEVLVISNGNDEDCSLIQVKGHFTWEDIDKLTIQ